MNRPVYVQQTYLRKKGEMFMSRKRIQKTGAVLALCGLLLLTLLTGAGSANAQSVGSNLQPRQVTHVVRTKNVAPHRSVVVQAFCPFRYRARSGQVKVFHPGKPNIFFLSRNAFTIRFSRSLPQRLGWVSSVRNNSGLPLRVQVTATCVR